MTETFQQIFEQIVKGFAGALGHWIGSAVALVLMGVAVIIGLKYLSKNAKDARFLTVILRVAKSLLAQRLGERGTAVFDALLSGLDSIQDGDFSQEEMTEELTQFVKVAVMGKFTLTDADLDTVREVCKTVISFFQPRKDAAPEAVKVMIMQSR